MDNIKRIHLLSSTEIEELYARPEFNDHEQNLYFSLSPAERAALEQFRNIQTRIYFILQLGYFKAKQQFFNLSLDEVSHDVQYIVATYYSDTDAALFKGTLSRKYMRSQRQAILSLFGYRNWSSQYTAEIESHLAYLLRYYPKGHNAFRQLLAYFEHQKLMIPSYRILQDMFSHAFIAEENRLNVAVSSLPTAIIDQLVALVQRDDGITTLNIIRADQKDFQYTAVRMEVDKALRIEDLYQFARDFLPSLGLSKNAIRYYAEIAEQYAASRLRRLSKTQQWLQALCFVYHRYQQIMDNLIVSFCYHTRAIMDAGKIYASIAHMEHSSRVVTDFPGLAKFLKWFPERDPNMSQAELNEVAFSMLPKAQFSVIAEFLEGKSFDKKAALWEYYGKSSRLLSLYLRPVFTRVRLEYYKKNSYIGELIHVLKTHYASGKSPSALKICDELGFTIPKGMNAYLKRKSSDTRIDPYLFEFFIYLKVLHEIERGRLYCNDSVSYCDIDTDLVDDALVDNVEKIAEEFGYSSLPVYCDQRLDEALQGLDEAWERTTHNIRENNNPGFNVRETKTGQQHWSLRYDSVEKLDDAFFKNLPKAEIANIVMFIGELTDLWRGFTHLKDRYTKRKKPLSLAINACLLSEAFGFGALKMADMSDLELNQLRAIREDFIRVDTLCAANEIVSNHIHSLAIFKQWNLMDDKVLADADGQKFATTDSTIQSRYSRKHLGKGRGISLYTLLANYVAVNAKNIGLNEYEGHSLYDMIYNNKTDIDIHMVTGDNHSLNKLNFVTLDSIDVDYVPSIKNVRHAADDIYSANPLDYDTGILKPKGVINVERIRSQRRGVLRVLLSLIMQENTQGNIIRKLNSHARYARLKAALFEYNAIFKSTHVLNLIDDMALRKAIRSARNRTEAYHQLQSNIRKTYNGIFKGKKIVENRVSAHAARLVANCIIAYNSMILNAVYQKMLVNDVSQEIIDEFTRISPIAWTHTLFTGRYNFKRNNGKIDVEAMARILESHLKQHFWRDD
ncbi:Tn3 family transposase [Xenorhabdus kozodoii]|uniref:Transposase n=3 Tax=Morganellaceae TaxID=1903414 RepID=A0A2D0L2T2_9GAMM|nr:Tn3 family transposase [Xenorhabdus kozodoii]PHM69990.1 transposase [Xenorhabdus kozodoii]